MHLVIAFASALSDEVSQVLPTLELPNLARLLARCAPTARDDAGPLTLSPPHERTLARAWGWHGGDGLWPFAALAARADGIDPGTAPWGLVTPSHWLVGRDQVTLLDPDELALDADESRALFDALRELFEGDGYTCAWGAPLRWYVSHDALDGLPCASLDRVVGRHVEPWLQSRASGDARSARLRRLQSEVQLALHAHPVNDAREERGALPVNSCWLSGCGTPQPATGDVTLDARLRTPALRGDIDGWAATWRALDADAIAALLAAADGGADAVLTLCGERAAQRFEPQPRSWWQRWRAPRTRPPHAWLAEL